MTSQLETLWFRTAGVTVRLDGCSGELAELVRTAGGGMADTAQDRAATYLRVTWSDGGLAHLDGMPLDPEPQRAAATVLAAVDRAALAATTSLCIHAAAVAGPGGAAILPGRSGAGKSTLTGACLQAGLSLLSDEAACLTADLDLLPHRRPLGLSRHSRSILGLDDLDDTEDEVAVAPSLVETNPLVGPESPVSLVAVLDRRAGEAAALHPVRPTEALALLMANRLSFGATAAWSAEDAWFTLSRLVSTVETARLTFDSPHEGAAVLVDRLAGDAGSR